MNKYRVIDFEELGDERGNLIVAEGESRFVPFEIKRVFYIYGSDATVVRGQHANKKTRFVMINVSGSCKIKVNDGISETIVNLDTPKRGLYLEEMLWKEMYDFSKDSVLLVLCSEHYNEAEYIRDFDKYVNMVNKEMN
ncbi:sugar 3,4-ketoisomerase [Butyrivibrio sp. AE2032]|uniref:sugar 3,4-ketoisomerase n=1 Tax=Butyrivibrio sp. AE2032 TaxID=1458463 RepID=UPI0005597934|nr:FdtA/QdtA family cupin domain-containing protein [Butyrivibrio sp. AE2032]